MAFWRNIFSSRRSRLNRFNRWFDRAVSRITKTIEKLALANQGIEQEMQEIAETRKALAIKMVEEPTISGLSILGGDPLCQDDNGLIMLSELCRRVREHGKTVWLWTGFTWEDVFSLPCRDIHHQCQKFLIADCNVVVDGTFKQELADRKLVWKGSSNQRVIDVQASLRADSVITYQE